MNSQAGYDLDQLASLGAREGRRWAIGCIPRRLFYVARDVEEVFDLDPLRLARIAYPELNEGQALRCLWLARWPHNLPIERSEPVDSYVGGFVKSSQSYTIKLQRL